MFKTQAIILHIQKIRDNQSRIILFTKEYGKISCWYKKKGFFGDLGDTVTVIIDRHLGENILKNMEITDRIRIENGKFIVVIAFLEIIKVFHSLLPYSVPHVHIFDDYVNFIHSIKGNSLINQSHYFLFQLRILKNLGFVDEKEFKQTPRLNYIHDNISIAPLRRVLESKPLSESESVFIQKINQKTLYQLL